MGIVTVSNVPLQQFLQSIARLITANMDASATVPINGKSYSKTDLLAAIASIEKPYDDVDAAHTGLTNLILARDLAEPTALDFALGYSAGIRAVFGSDPAALSKYGVAPRAKAKPLTGEEIVARKAKAKVTRTLRNTLGSRQKAKLKASGDFTVIASPSGPASATPATGSAAGSGSTVAPPAPSPIAASAGSGDVAANGAIHGIVAPLLANGADH